MNVDLQISSQTAKQQRNNTCFVPFFYCQFSQLVGTKNGLLS